MYFYFSHLTCTFHLNCCLNKIFVIVIVIVIINNNIASVKHLINMPKNCYQLKLVSQLGTTYECNDVTNRNKDLRHFTSSSRVIVLR